MRSIHVQHKRSLQANQQSQHCTRVRKAQHASAGVQRCGLKVHARREPLIRGNANFARLSCSDPLAGWLACSSHCTCAHTCIELAFGRLYICACACDSLALAPQRAALRSLGCGCATRVAQSHACSGSFFQIRSFRFAPSDLFVQICFFRFVCSVASEALNGLQLAHAQLLFSYCHTAGFQIPYCCVVLFCLCADQSNANKQEVNLSVNKSL